MARNHSAKGLPSGRGTGGRKGLGLEANAVYKMKAKDLTECSQLSRQASELGPWPKFSYRYSPLDNEPFSTFNHLRARAVEV